MNEASKQLALELQGVSLKKNLLLNLFCLNPFVFINFRNNYLQFLLIKTPTFSSSSFVQWRRYWTDINLSKYKFAFLLHTRVLLKSSLLVSKFFQLIILPAEFIPITNNHTNASKNSKNGKKQQEHKI